VILNANDIAASGATPLWFTATILLPEGKTTLGLCDAIFSSIAEECHKRSIAVVAGHTEITVGLDRPILAGTMVGTIPPNKKRVSTFGGKPGDALLLIKDIAIEGTAIIAREKGQYLRQQGVTRSEIEEAKQYLYQPGISSMQESLFLTDNFDIHALHGPTEGGVKAGIAELVQNSHCGAIIYVDQIQIPALTQKLCKLFEIDPLGLISSGCLLVAVAPQLAPKIIAECKARRLVVQQIGALTSNDGILVFEDDDGTQTRVKHSHRDEITKIFG
jgi:hydrogenase expression/formation protein HypE